MITCYICIESVPPQNVVSCLCKFEACSDCVGRYLLESPLDPHCMKCKVAWNTEFLVNKLGKNFLYQQYKAHRENVLLEREIARLPEALALIQHEIEKKKWKEEIRDLLLEKAHVLEKEIETIPNPPTMRQTSSKALIAQAKEIDEMFGLKDLMKAEAKRAFDEYYEAIETDPMRHNYPDYLSYVEAKVEWYGRRAYVDVEQIYWDDYADRLHRIMCRLDQKQDLFVQFQQRIEQAAHKASLQSKVKTYLDHSKSVLTTNLGDETAKKEIKHRFIRACPAEGCRGLLTEDWYCPLCKGLTCSRCQEIKKEEHKCLPESVETAKLLKQDTKPCPGCASMIFKIEGCDQMFCTQCGTAFSWNTGRKETGVIHNPHFYEYQRQRGENRAQPALQHNPCQAYDIGWSAIMEVYRNISESNPLEPSITKLSGMARYYIHNRETMLPHYDINPPFNMDLRLRFLKKEIDEAKFKDLLQRRDKDYNKRKDYHGVLSTYLDAQSDILKRADEIVKDNFYRDTLTVEMLTPFITEADSLREEFNGWLLKTGQYYNCLAPHIHTDYEIYPSPNQAPGGLVRKNSTAITE